MANFNYQLYKNLFSRIFASYQDQNHRNPNVDNVDGSTTTTSYKQKVYSVGGSLSYSFWHWFTATAGYTFSRQTSNSDLALGYDDHRVYVTIGANKEFFHW